MACLSYIDLTGDVDWRIVSARADAELAEFALSPDGERAALVWNIAGAHELELTRLSKSEDRRRIALPDEVVDSLRFSPDGEELALTITGARLPQDIWLLRVDSGDLRQMTRSPRVGVDLGKLAPASLLTFCAHDGMELTGWHYAPREREPPRPTVLSFHGGPERQEQPRFRADYQALSPIDSIDKVVAPTLVLHGANDANVPVCEAQQVVAALRQRSVPVEYNLFPDEGHGFASEDNRISATTAIGEWFGKYLLG